MVMGALWVVSALPALAQSDGALCPQPQGVPVLHLRPADQVARACDLQGLMALPAKELATSLPPELGLSGRHRWQGVPLRLLAERLGGGPASAVQLTALNDYTVTIPWSDLLQYDPILAYQRDGQPMSVRDKGPLILIYPFDTHRGLRTQLYRNRTIWQVNALTLK